MSYLVHVTGRRNHMKFSSFSSADNYRHIICMAGIFAYVTCE